MFELQTLWFTRQIEVTFLFGLARGFALCLLMARRRPRDGQSIDGAAPQPPIGPILEKARSRQRKISAPSPTN